MSEQQQLRAVTPRAGELFVSALLYSTAAEVNDVLALVHDNDVDWPLDVLLAAVRRLAGAGAPPGPQLVLDDLKRSGAVHREVYLALMSAATNGACASAARNYAGAVVAESLRRQVDSAGHALVTAAQDSAEDDLPVYAERAARQIRDTADRLAALRGEVAR